MPERYRIDLAALPDPPEPPDGRAPPLWAGVPPDVRLRQALKELLRRWGLQCLGHRDLAPEEGPDEPTAVGDVTLTLTPEEAVELAHALTRQVILLEVLDLQRRADLARRAARLHEVLARLEPLLPGPPPGADGEVTPP